MRSNGDAREREQETFSQKIVFHPGLLKYVTKTLAIEVAETRLLNLIDGAV